MNTRVMAARASSNPTITGRWSSPHPPEPQPSRAQQPRTRRSPRMTAAQRDSRGRRSDWSRSPYAPRGGWR